MPHTPTTVDHLFVKSAPSVRATYTEILKAAKRFGAVRVEPKKTSIHFVRRTAFAGVATRKDAVILTLKSGADVSSSRIGKHERVSANRWHLEVRLEAPSEVNREIVGWLRAAYELSA